MTQSAVSTPSTHFNVPIAIETQSLVDAVTAGMITGPHGYGYWCERVEVRDEDRVAEQRFRGPLNDEELAENVLAGGTITVWELDEQTLKRTPHTLDLAKLVAGFLAAIVTLGARRNAQITNGVWSVDVDAAFSDVVLQYALFGEERYG